MTASRFSRRAAFGAAVFLAGAIGAQGAMAQNANCIDTIAGLPEASRFVGVASRVHVAQDLREASLFTVFVPTNAAIDAVRPALVPILFPVSGEGGAAVDPVLGPAAVNAHILQGRFTSAALAPGATVTVPSRAGTPITLSNNGGKVTLTANGVTATVVRADIPCANGVIHVIDHSLVR
ncbi:fasciclin domain-containing protein [Falsiroseomonas sp.]|uniref:fasciclin domain-containing protein n=1 Tax=Falsiroseomonas sp. TaxID=2870721 RepID=UPI003F70DBC2